MPPEERQIVVARVQGKKSDDTFEYILSDDAGRLQVWDPKVGSLISYSGTTTADGGALGINLVCSDLTTEPDYDGNLVIITSGVCAGQARDINGITTGGTVTPSIHFGSPTGAGVLIVAGTTFVIVGITTTPAEVAAIEAKLDKMLFSMDFWSLPVEEVAVPAGEATLNTLPSVVVAGLPGGAVIVRAIAMFKARMIENINGAANSLDGATDPGVRQVIQVKDSAAGAQTDAIKFVDEQFSIGAGPLREGGDVLIGSINLAGAGIVDADDTYAFRWLLAKAHLLGINFNDVQTGLRILYSV